MESPCGRSGATGARPCRPVVAPLATGEATFTAISSGTTLTRAGCGPDGSVACWG